MCFLREREREREGNVMMRYTIRWMRDTMRAEVAAETVEMARTVYILHVYAPEYKTAMHIYAMCRVSSGSSGSKRARGRGTRRQAAVAEVAAASRGLPCVSFVGLWTRELETPTS
jgi:hypothetical protein